MLAVVSFLRGEERKRILKGFGDGLKMGVVLLGRKGEEVVITILGLLMIVQRRKKARRIK